MFGEKSNRIEYLLHDAIALFTNGYNEEVIPMFETVLNSPNTSVKNKSVSSCLLGEIYRVLGNFGRAQLYYEWSIQESNKISVSMQIVDEYIRHYRPRAYCGLLTVYRRILFEDHEKIKKLLEEIKSNFVLFAIEDLPAVSSLLEGLYLRQLGDLSSSIACISKGLDSIREATKVTRYFLFMNPEHFEAFLLITHLCTPGNTFHIRRISNEVLKANRGPWSLAFAAAGQLHLHLRKVSNSEFTNFSSNEFAQDSETVSQLIETLQKNARFENDPLLITECAMLSLIWYLLIEDFEEAEQELKNIEKMIPSCSEPLVLLRSVEIGSLQMELELAGLAHHTSLEEIFSQGQDALSLLTRPLQSYGCSIEFCQSLKTLLARKNRDNIFLLKTWVSDELTQLRCRVWP